MKELEGIVNGHLYWDIETGVKAGEQLRQLKVDLKECRELLIDMVNQYCRNSSGEPTTYSHDFMSTGEAVFSYLVKHGLAEWAENGEDIRLKHLEEK